MKLTFHFSFLHIFQAAEDNYLSSYKFDQRALSFSCSVATDIHFPVGVKRPGYQLTARLH